MSGFYEQIIDTIPPGGYVERDLTDGDFLHLERCEQPFIIVSGKFRGGYREYELAKAIALKIPFDQGRMRFMNPHTTAVNVKINVAGGGDEIVDYRNVPTDPIDIFGNQGVRGQPLTEDGGSIVALGSSLYARGFIETAGDTKEVIVTESQNLNGINIKTINMTVSIPTVNGNNSLFLGVFSVGVLQNIIFGTRLEGSTPPFTGFFIPPGLSLEVGSNSSRGRVDVSYDLL